MTEFFELLKTRRSVRDFEPREVPLELTTEIIKDSCLAPSSGNGQPWRFIVVNTKDCIRRLSDESKRNLLLHLERDPDAPSKKYEAALRSEAFNVFYNAPCVVFIVGPKKIPTLQVDCTLAACYFMFSASARGLGTCWIGLGKHIQDPELLKLIGMSEDCQIVAPIVLGYPKSIPNAPERSEPQVLKVVS